LSGGEHDADPEHGIQRHDRAESRTGGEGESRPDCGVADLSRARDEPVQTGQEPEQQGQVERLQADGERDCGAVLVVEGEDLGDRVAIGGCTGGEHDVLDHQGGSHCQRQGADDSRLTGMPCRRGVVRHGWGAGARVLHEGSFRVDCWCTPRGEMAGAPMAGGGHVDLDASRRGG